MTEYVKRQTFQAMQYEESAPGFCVTNPHEQIHEWLVSFVHKGLAFKRDYMRRVERDDNSGDEGWVSHGIQWVPCIIHGDSRGAQQLTDGCWIVHREGREFDVLSDVMFKQQYMAVGNMQ